MQKKLIIFGTGEIATLAKFYFTYDSEYKVVGFSADDEYCHSEIFEDLPLVPFSRLVTLYPPDQYDLHVALSYVKLNKLREEKYFQVKKAGYKLASYVSSKCTTWPDLSIGDNCFILEDQTIQPTVTIGNNVMLWSGNHIGHGTQIGDHSYLASQVVISGNCKVGERCFFGVNATLKDFLTIGSDVFIAMDASVTKDLPSGSVILGHRSTVYEPDNLVGQKIKKLYFKL